MTSSATPTYFQTMSPAQTSTPTSTSTTTPAAPQASQLPPSSDPPPSSNPPPSRKPSNHQIATSECLAVIPDRKPLLRLELRDLSSSGTQSFLRLLHASHALEDAVNNVLSLLYYGLDTKCIPPTRSITLILESMGGVAYTTGKAIDDDHKEIHFSTDYISQVSDTRLKEEMQGVIVHEMVHCWQHNGQGAAPGGLIEGIADWVRLKAGYAPPHWRRSADEKWDAGYERTAYFLEFLEEKHGDDIVRRINEGLRGCKYEEGELWEKCCGHSIEKLWEGYQKSLANDDGPGKKDSKQEEGKEAEGSSKVEEEQQEPQQDEDDEADEPNENGTTEDTRSARVKARRGGRMHVPVRGGPSS
jgi:hypothetical protein